MAYCRSPVDGRDRDIGVAHWSGCQGPGTRQIRHVFARSHVPPHVTRWSAQEGRGLVLVRDGQSRDVPVYFMSVASRPRRSERSRGRKRMVIG